jgi:hypothetical protein
MSPTPSPAEAVSGHGAVGCVEYITIEAWCISTISAALAKCSQAVLERAGLDQAGRLRFFVLEPSDGKPGSVSVRQAREGGA